MEEEEEKLRISRYFRNVMKLVAKEVMAKKLVTKEDLYHLFEANSSIEQISTSPFYIKYKFTKKNIPKVTMKCEFISLKIPLKYCLIGSFRVLKPKKNKKRLAAKKFYFEEC
ncbi:hypothetical protein [Polaribacter glomeratus]|uniref:Uncharacterized protein n=1 Tax=Polaribacter glomeratus TaxID=102 RepID=A0A2S7WYV3_9FLAO|nr:hypothetical protein [Polaribacter glomeratus]PQJ82774.1 hypothetical protein BTO16_09375 [Polaribacter glomeratus]TXD65317.1 hypothetical protein ESX12_10860 [Polaribacter glomeratus]